MLTDTLIAIVDDDAPLRLALDNLIRSGGYRTILFPDAETFLGRQHEGAPDLLITDFQMPGMSGLDLIQTLRRHGSRIPIIMMTALAFDQLSLRAEAAGAFICLEKPFDEAILFSAIERALEI